MNTYSNILTIMKMHEKYKRLKSMLIIRSGSDQSVKKIIIAPLVQTYTLNSSNPATYVVPQ